MEELTRTQPFEGTNSSSNVGDLSQKLTLSIVPLIIHLLTGMEVTVVKPMRKDQLSWDILHKTKLRMEPVMV